MVKLKGIRLSHCGEKALEAVDAHSRDRLKEAVLELSVNPLLGKKLKGEFEGLRSHRVGSFRIVYRFSRELLEIVFIDDRKDIYR